MSHPVIAAWHALAQARDPSKLDALLADDVVFQSPIVHTPQVGKAITTKYLAAALEVLGAGNARYEGEWYAENSAVLNFVAVLDGVEIDGVDIITWNSDNQITRFKVMVRPARAMQTLGPLMVAKMTASQQQQQQQ